MRVEYKARENSCCVQIDRSPRMRRQSYMSSQAQASRTIKHALRISAASSQHLLAPEQSPKHLGCCVRRCVWSRRCCALYAHVASHAHLGTISCCRFIAGAARAKWLAIRESDGRQAQPGNEKVAAENQKEKMGSGGSSSNSGLSEFQYFNSN